MKRTVGLIILTLLTLPLLTSVTFSQDEAVVRPGGSIHNEMYGAKKSYVSKSTVRMIAASAIGVVILIVIIVIYKRKNKPFVRVEKPKAKSPASISKIK